MNKEFYEDNFNQVTERYDRILDIVLDITKRFLLDEIPYHTQINDKLTVPYDQMKIFLLQSATKSQSLQQEQQMHYGSLQMEMSEAGFQITFAMTIVFTAFEEKMK